MAASESPHIISSEAVVATAGTAVALAASGRVTGRDDRMACPVFSPIDALEASQRKAPARSSE